MTTDQPAERRSDPDPGVSRMLTLSDSVLAFALTLLVLQFTVPVVRAGEDRADINSAAVLARGLAHDGDKLVAYLIAFFVIAQFWLAHHWVLHRLTGHHEGVVWLNFGFLFTITALPFTSNLLGSYGNNPLAIDIFGLNLLLATLATQAITLVGQRTEVLTVDAESGHYRAARARVPVILVLIALSMGLAWVDTTAATWCWYLMPVAAPVSRRWAARRGRAGALGAPPSG